MMICDLSDDLLINILVRLPLESLGQLKCVSKSLNSLISTHNFIDSHLNQSRIVQKPNVFVDEFDYIQMVEFFSITGDFDCKLKEIYCLPEERVIMQILGSANGLLCLLLSPEYEDDYIFALCNPLTKSTWELPGNQWKRLFTYASLFGFRYDDVNDDYNVVIMNLVVKDVGIHVYECQVYSLRSNSWSMVRLYLDFSFDYKFSESKCVVLTCAGVLANCALHWILLDLYHRPIFILAFDLRTYKHNLLPLPQDLVLGVREHLKLTVLNASLVLNSCRADGEVNDSWIMKDYGLNNSWTRIIINKTYVGEEFITPLALLEDYNNHKRLLIGYENSKNQLQLIDLVSHQEHVIEAPCDLKDAYQVQFVGSLVQPYPPFVGYENVSSEEDRFENKLISLDLVANGESLIQEQTLNVPKNFDKFRIHVHGVSIDSQLPEHVRRKYYDLCCKKKSFLHERLVPDIPSKLAVSMIIEVVNIADSIRSCRFTTTSKQ